jgi:hypothetical protein
MIHVNLYDYGSQYIHFLNQEYSELLDEFMAAVRQNYGQKVLVQVWKIVENKLFVSY